jgi:hypothetical protein
VSINFILLITTIGLISNLNISIRELTSPIKQYIQSDIDFDRQLWNKLNAIHLFVALETGTRPTPMDLSSCKNVTQEVLAMWCAGSDVTITAPPSTSVRDSPQDPQWRFHNNRLPDDNRFPNDPYLSEEDNVDPVSDKSDEGEITADASETGVNDD